MPLNILVDSGVPASTQGADIQKTSFAIDSVARFVCNTWDEAVQAQSGNPFDIVVIGSGMYGGYCANKLFSLAERLQREGSLLAEDKPRILVLEQGPFLVDEHVQNLSRAFFGLDGEVKAQPALSNVNTLVDHHECVGGKSLFWGGWTPKLTAADLAQWPAEVVAYLAQTGKQDGYEFVQNEIGTTPSTDFIKGKLTERMFNLSKTIVARGTVPTLKKVEEAPIAVLGDSPISGLFSMDKYSSLPHLFDSIRDDVERNKVDESRRLFLVPNAKVVHLTYSNGMVTEIVVVLTEVSKNVVPSRRLVRLTLDESAVVVLAGNTINSTRLALNSFPRPATLGQELMGRNLMAHVRGNWKWRVHRSVLEKAGESVLDELKTAAWNIRGETDSLNAAGRKGRFHFQSYATGLLTNPPFDNAVADPDQYLYRMIPNLEDLQDILNSLKPDWVSVTLRTTGETFGAPEAPVGTPGVGWINVNPFGGTGDDVYFDATGAELRVPKAFINLVEPADDRKVREAQTAAADAYIAALAGVPVADVRGRRISGSESLIDRKLGFIRGGSGEDDPGTTYHECGTLWMGEDPLASVTDVGGRFHHVANVACVDQALFPTAGSANPVPTGITLSRMVTRRLLQRFIDTSDTPAASAVRTLYQGNLGNWNISGAGVGADRFTPITVGGSQILEVGETGPGPLGILWFDEAFADFELQVDWKAFDIEANSGIFLRMPRPPATLDDAFYDSALEVQIDERGFDVANNVFGSPLHKTGALYDRIPARQWAAKAVVRRFGPRPGFWNRFVIRVQGSQIDILLNDRPTVENGVLPQDVPASGFIGVQCHTDVVQFRNIRIKPV